jgi:hypothetical protein
VTDGSVSTFDPSARIALDRLRAEEGSRLATLAEVGRREDLRPLLILETEGGAR